VKSGRVVRLLVTISDATGSLARLTRLLADCKASVVQIHHDRTFASTELNEAVVEVSLETRGFDHIEEVKGALVAAGYRLL
jgi:threonine dehydratase